MRRPIILLTVSGRYFELVKNCEENFKLFSEFKIPPIIVLVWVNPIPGYFWIIKYLLKMGFVHRVVGKLDNSSGGSISSYHAENLEYGFNFIKENFAQEDYYLIVQCADILVKKGTYRFLDREMNGEEGEARCVVFHLPNSLTNQEAWHTNFYAAIPHPDYLSFPCTKKDTILEIEFAEKLVGKFFVCKSHNANERIFIHRHEQENNPKFALIGAKFNQNFTLNIVGKMNIWRRLCEWCKFLKKAFFRRKKWQK